MATSAHKENSITEILQHRISWYLTGDNAAPAEMDESSIEHIEGLIKEGYNQGELLVTNEAVEEFRGWWHIETESHRESPRG